MFGLRAATMFEEVSRQKRGDQRFDQSAVK